MLMTAPKDDDRELRPILKPLHDPVADIPLRWYAVQTNPGREKLVQSQFALLGYRVFWPHNIIHRMNRRNRWRRLPDADAELSYFSGYVFLGVRFTQPLIGTRDIFGAVGLLGGRSAPLAERDPERPHTMVGSEPKPQELPEDFMRSLLNAAVPGICSRCDARGRRIDPVSGSCGLVGEIDDHPPAHEYRPGHVVRFHQDSPFYPHTARVLRVDRHGLVDVEANLFGQSTPFRGLHHSQLGEVVDTPSAAARRQISE